MIHPYLFVAIAFAAAAVLTILVMRTLDRKDPEMDWLTPLLVVCVFLSGASLAFWNNDVWEERHGKEPKVEVQK